MKGFIRQFRFLIFWALLPITVHSQDYIEMFNGKDLTGWTGREGFWRVENGSIVGQTTPENSAPGNTFLVWEPSEVDDFEMIGEVRFTGNNSGVQYRSEFAGDPGEWVLRGYQADLHPSQEYFGMLYGEKYGQRGIIALRGQKVDARGDGVQILGKVGDGTSLNGEEWNTLRIIAFGKRIIHLVNEVVTVDVTENHPDAIAKGRVGLQLHAGPPMKVEFRKLKIRRVSGDEGRDLVEYSARLNGGDQPTSEGHFVKGSDTHWYKKTPLMPDWIWLEGNPVPPKVYFRKTIEVPQDAGIMRIYAACANRFQMHFDGKLEIGSSTDWRFPAESELVAEPGKHVISVVGENTDGVAGFTFILEYQLNGAKNYIISDTSWEATNAVEGDRWQTVDYDDSGWTNQLVSRGKLGVKPWGIPDGALVQEEPPREGDPTHPEAITTLDGFTIEPIYTVPKAEQGSWVSLTVDDQGRFYASDQGRQGLYQITISESETGPVPVVKPVSITHSSEKAPLSGAQGLQFAGGKLYFHRNGGNLYQLIDSDGDGELDKSEKLPGGTGGGEHGNHGVILSQDGKSLYLAGGNHAPLAGVTRSAVTSWKEDLLLPRLWDARGHARGRLAPGGWITRMGMSDHSQEVISIGYRNQYDIALNKHGDLFTYDADMEWDMGNRWYRPTRICLAVSGSDYGWRSGTGKWPTYYEDSLPPVVEMGPGSPTGIVSGAGTSFPEKYQDALFGLDWTFGTIYAIHLTENGAGYQGEAEPFLWGTPLPLTDAVVGKDGNLYFIIGGRGAQSALFRVCYTGPEEIPSPSLDPAAAAARAQRRKLESFHGLKHPDAVSIAWSHLSSPDRFLRNAARVAVESQPVADWADRVLRSTQTQTIITGAVALARSNATNYREALTDKLLSLGVDDLDESQLLGLLRAHALTFIRLGPPPKAQRAKLLDVFEPLVPSPSDNVNHEVLALLVDLESTHAISKGMNLIVNRKAPEIPDWTELVSRNPRYGSSILTMLENYPPSQEISYALMLSGIKKGWTLEQRQDYFSFLNEAAKTSGGASFPGFLTNIRAEALSNCSDEERSLLSDITGENFNPIPAFEIHPPKGPGVTWTLDEAVAKGNRSNADFENGRSLYFAIGCGACHRINGIGGGVGPDLTTIPNKFDARYVLESIIDPGKNISDQYGTSIVTMKDGALHTGIVVPRGETLEIYPPDAKAQPIIVVASEVVKMEESSISQMPPGLINSLNENELRDLVAYLMSGGNRNDARFKP